jgi:hypothetical protein
MPNRFANLLYLFYRIRERKLFFIYHMNVWNQIQQEQKAICDKLKVDWMAVDEKSFIAINDSLFSDTKPINGLRHPKHGKIDGWYLWSGGEIPQQESDFFKPLHTEHLIQVRPIVLKYLGLPPGWRFQIDDNGYEDIWFDESILNI